jgi:hypothetical protein
MRDSQLGRGQVADEQLLPGGHRRGLEHEGDGLAGPFSPYDAVDPGTDAAGIQGSVVLGSRAEDAFLDENRLLSQVTWTVPSVWPATAKAAVWM